MWSCMDSTLPVCGSPSCATCLARSSQAAKSCWRLPVPFTGCSHTDMPQPVITPRTQAARHRTPFRIWKEDAFIVWTRTPGWFACFLKPWSVHYTLSPLTKIEAFNRQLREIFLRPASLPWIKRPVCGDPDLLAICLRLECSRDIRSIVLQHP